VRTILLAARKGGVGKTTLAVHLAALADRPKSPSLLIDCDPQASAEFWYGRRKARTPLLVKASAGEVAGIIEDARKSCVGTVIIDSAPHDVGGSATLMKLVDLVIIPTRPGVLDLASVSATIEAAKALKVPHLVALNHCPPGREDRDPSVVAEARHILVGMGGRVAPSFVAQRAALAHSLVSGSSVFDWEPAGRAAAEISSLWTSILKLTPERKN